MAWVWILFGSITVAYVATFIFLYIKGPAIRQNLTKEVRRLLGGNDPLSQYKNTLIDPSKFTKRR